MSMYPPAGPPPGYGPPPGFGPPDGYQPNPYGGGYPQDHPQGTTILVLGILSIVICGLLAPVAWIMGNKAIKEIDANPGRYRNRGMVQAGRIIGAVYSILAIVAIVAVIVLAVATGTSRSVS